MFISFLDKIGTDYSDSVLLCFKNLQYFEFFSADDPSSQILPYKEVACLKRYQLNFSSSTFRVNRLSYRKETIVFVCVCLYYSSTYDTAV